MLSTDFLFGGAGQDTLKGGSGLDFYVYDLLIDLPAVAVDDTNVNEGVFGDFINDADGIGVFDQGQFGILPLGPLVDGLNFDSIGVPFDGTNANSEAFLEEQPSFIFLITHFAPRV